MKAILSFLALAFAYASADMCNYIMYTFSSSGVYIPTDICVGYTTSIYNSSSMYSCMTTSTNMYYVSYMSYDNYDCSGNATTTYSIWANDTDYQFLCSADACAVEYELKSYSVSDCSGDADSTYQYGIVAGVCYNSSSTSLVYGCTDDSYTVYSYSDGQCGTLLAKFKYSEECLSVSSISTYYSIAECSKPGYYGIASSQIPAFSTFVSFVMIAIAFFVC